MNLRCRLIKRLTPEIASSTSMEFPQTPQPQINGDFKYAAFISYSHTDKTWGDWLHRALETYRVPRRLVGTASRHGKVPPRIFPVFRDREELPTSADLGAQLREALRQSRFLIVICSPRSAHSRWVKEEILQFKSFGREDRVLCLIVDGEPNAADRPESESQECFGEALRYHLGSDGRLTDQRSEPIAADARPGQDGRANARLKLIAGILGVNYDDLRQRERRRTQRRRLQWSALASVVCLAGLSLWEIQEQAKIRQARAALIERDIDHGRQQLLAGDGLRALPYLSEAYSLGDTRPALRFLLARATEPLDAKSTSFSGNGKGIKNVSFCPDGKRLLVSYTDGTAAFRDVATGRTVVPLDPALPSIQHLALSLDGRRVIASYEGNAWILDAGTGRILQRLQGHEMDIKSARFSTDSRRAITASVDNTAKVWDTETGSLLLTLRGHEASVVLAFFSRDASRIVTASTDGSVKIWDAQTGKALLSLDAGDSVLDAVLSPDAKHLVTTTFHRDVVVWDCASGRKVATNNSSERVCQAFFGENGDKVLFVSLGPDNTVIIRDALSPKVVATLSGHTDTVTNARVTADGRRIISTSWDGTSRIWDAATGSPLFTLQPQGQAGPLKSDVSILDISRDGCWIASLSGSGIVSLWNPNMPDRLPSGGSDKPVSQAFYSRDGRQIVTASFDTICIFDAETNRLMRRIATPDLYVLRLAMNRDGGRLAAAVGHNRVRLWNAASGQVIATVDGTAVHFSSDGSKFIVAAKDFDPVIYDSGSGRTILSLHAAKHLATDAVFSPDLKKIATVAPDHTVILWDAASGKMAGRLLSSGKGPNQTGAPVFSPDGKFIFTIDGGSGKVWEVKSGKLIADIAGHSFAMLDASFNTDGSRVISAGGDGSAKIWAAHDGRLLATLQCGATFVDSFELSRDGALALTATPEGVVIRDVLHAEQLARFSGLKATFSPDEHSILTIASESGEAAIRTDEGIGAVIVIRLPLEMRSPMEISALVRQRDPWRLSEDGLIGGEPSGR